MTDERQILKRVETLEKLLAVRVMCSECGQPKPEPPEHQKIREVIAEVRALFSKITSQTEER